ncbi:hypothetical protein XMM379_000673 [Aliiroseovarius sp. xm-m-379]|uniref:hypothetical protein n=1 Tax=unclassified Aliiroseovarius TaxID=2623558 RepID=UPI001569D8AF|nr:MULTISPECIES: hypothetical protein [unclassified Aliiroseovarius]NRP13172.1 hypothetical protein [Aliiroseovarius sp. xm-d-517]NRP23995.1 hypothetical protein [Aliiroseovarius sp. xm-m-379]NRP30194.1 hypothetical protein [Aliiroseovarius sp. xm-m-314]NRP32794.1 hypothetical protein [Aliiroseovarius sp. xm-a-104]NRP40353.1 hypothetical protein [Aliiroseovarius sp. xm-m-339-2]
MYTKLQYLFAVIAVVVTPTVSMLTYYAATGDPSLRPLAASFDRMRTYFVRSGDIVVEVSWGEFARSGLSQDQVKSMLRSAFLSKGIDAHVIIRARPRSEHIRVTYRVGASEFGPMNLSETPRAVRSVTAAYRMGKNS